MKVWARTLSTQRLRVDSALYTGIITEIFGLLTAVFYTVRIRLISFRQNLPPQPHRKDPDAAIPRSIFITNLTGLVLAAVIDEKALEIGESLGQDAVHTASQGRFCIIYGYYY